LNDTQEHTMIDRIFPAVLTFCILAGGAFAFGTELFGGDVHRDAQRLNVARAASQAKVVQLPRVEVHAKRAAASEAMALSESVELAVRHFQ
jgi:hypothetical protein